MYGLGDELQDLRTENESLQALANKRLQLLTDTATDRDRLGAALAERDALLAEARFHLTVYRGRVADLAVARTEQGSRDGAAYFNAVVEEIDLLLAKLPEVQQ